MILLCYGTRPEWIKIKPLIEEFKKSGFEEYRTIFTAQQKDIGKFEYDWILNINDGVNRLDSIVSSILSQMWEVFRFFEPTHVLVQGDTTTAMAIALSAFHHGVKVIHLEAGLRTYDRENPYPEETNRRIISQIADIHLCPTNMNRAYLENERLLGDKYVVGNTAIDNLLPWKEKVNTLTNNVLITLHRRENHALMKEWFGEINNIAKKYDYLQFIFPVHPNPNVQSCKKYIDAPNIKLIEPCSHEELLNILVNSRLVITDSGGLQEECSFFNIKCLVCRKVTERPEAVGFSSVMIGSPLELPSVFSKYVNNFHFQYECPYGDGHSARKITEILKEII